MEPGVKTVSTLDMLFMLTCGILFLVSCAYYAIFPDKVYQRMLRQAERPIWLRRYVPFLHYVWFGSAPKWWSPLTIRVAGIVGLMTVGIPAMYSIVLYLARALHG
jgi:hypothetical protein